MKIFYSIVLLSLTIAFTSCMNDYHSNLLVKGKCIKEINMKYVRGARPINLYRVESVQGRTINISTWHNNAWLFMKEKPKRYFSDSKTFVYKKTNCPGIKDERGIADKIKSIEID
jgi:hypothetical protein